jgi:predicted O-methyltransferase YrrM
MNQLISKILSTRKVVSDTGEVLSLNSSIDEDEANFINNLITKNELKKSIEIGCAMGISSLAICDAIKSNAKDSHHIIIDPFQSTDWRNIGISNLKSAGFTNYTHYEEKSELILPSLVKNGVFVDFAFIDGWHTFDHTLLDFFYINKMLSVGGIIVIDDVQMTAINKVIRYIHKYPCYEFAGAVTCKQTYLRIILESFKSIIRPFPKIIGQRLAYEIFSSSLLESDRMVGANSSMIAFKKIKEDNERPWNWYKNF